MLHDLAQWLVDTIFELGYVGILLLMGIESSFIPFPSEIVLVPAGYLASQGQMNIFLILLMALLGSLLGALVNYYGALWLGRKFLLRYGHYVFIKPETLENLEQFFAKHGHISTLTGRLIPGIRQLISLPAGLAKMDIRVFLFYTSIGAGAWSLILIVLGYFIGENQELIKAYLSQITLAVLFLIIVALGVYFYLHKRKKKNTF